jgi:signal peptidase I
MLFAFRAFAAFLLIVCCAPPAAWADTSIVRGHSMEPLIADGSEVEVVPASGVALRRGDIVTVRVSDGQTIIKSVKGIPGDGLALPCLTRKGAPRSAVREGGCERSAILVNGKSAKNSAGVTYAIDERGSRMLALYVNDYGGVIPQDTYLLLGDNPHGSRDSTALGLIDRSDIVGKVVGIDPPH